MRHRKRHGLAADLFRHMLDHNHCITLREAQRIANQTGRSELTANSTLATLKMRGLAINDGDGSGWRLTQTGYELAWRDR